MPMLRLRLRLLLLLLGWFSCYCEASNTSISTYSGADPLVLLDSGGQPYDYFGLFGAVFSPSSRYVVGCSQAANSLVGKCVVWRESAPGAQDWGATDNQITLYDDANVDGDSAKLGVFGIEWSANDQHIMACQDWLNSQTGVCVIWSETVPGAQDWHANQYRLVGGATSDYFGEGGARFSSTAQYVLACSKGYLSRLGKCQVLGATSNTTHDWDANPRLDLFSPNGFTDDYFGVTGGFWSDNDEHITICAPHFDGYKGRCYLYSETTVGTRDWQNNIHVLYDATAEDGDYFGTGGSFLNFDNQHVIACAWGRYWSKGQCVVLSESSLGSRDWNSTQQILIDDEGVIGDSLAGQSVPKWSPDGSFIVACAPEYSSTRGKVVVFYETSIGSADWNNNQKVLENVGAAKWDALGYGGASISPNGQHIVACRYQFGSNLGGCLIFSETNVGSRDWDLSLVPLVSSEVQADDEIGYNGVSISSDGKHIAACAHGNNFGQGKCLVFTPDFEDQCVSNPCYFGAACTDLEFAYSCACVEGTTGAQCETDIDQCMSDPCSSNGTLACSDDGSVLNSFNCTCNTGYTGILCDADVDDCLSDPCVNGICSDDGAVPNTFDCACGVEYTGNLCAEDAPMYCAGSPCLYGNCSTEGMCICESGYTGMDCDTDVNDCTAAPESNPCSNNATCSDDGSVPHSFNCTCLSGFNGTLCDHDMDDCASGPCDVEGSSGCHDLGADLFECKCNDGYSGVWCEVAPACDAAPCQNNGTCTSMQDEFGTPNGLFECSCVPGTSGSVCEIDLDDCPTALCEELGTKECFDVGINDYVCTCLDSWWGTYCELSNERTFEILMQLSPEEVDAFSATLEADLEQQYPGSRISVIPGNASSSEDNTVVFQVVFLVDEAEIALPSQAALEQVIVAASYDGTLITTEDDEEEEDTVVDDTTEEPTLASNPLLIVVLVGVVLLVAIGCILMQRLRRQQHRIKSTSREIYKVPL